MSNFRIFETDQFCSDIETLPPQSKAKLYRKIQEYVYKQISENPYFGNNIKKLKDFSPETWRYRIGSYRLFYEIEDKNKIVSITAFAKRKDAY